MFGGSYPSLEMTGGEKALTVLTLLLAICLLSHAPFCLVDEVGTLLDDANVVRYSCLVKEISGKMKFIYITHNNIAMELANQFFGVTIHESGCSQ